MEHLNEEQLAKKFQITFAATDCYLEHGKDFSFHDVARETGMDVGELFKYFGNKQEMLEFFYTSLIMRYRMMIEEIDDFESYSVSEKLSNFIYSSFDMMNEKRAFVEATFRPLVTCSCASGQYKEEIETLCKQFISNDPQVSASASVLNQPFFIQILRQKYLYLVQFWLDDESENQELSMELTDKLTSLLQEVLYNSLADRTVDFFKFIYTNRLWARYIPFWEKLSSKIDIR